jgi:hypothetical protein
VTDSRNLINPMPPALAHVTGPEEKRQMKEWFEKNANNFDFGVKEDEKVMKMNNNPMRQ